MRLQERNQEIKKLNAIQERVSEGIYLKEDYLTMANILIKLVKDVKIN